MVVGPDIQGSVIINPNYRRDPENEDFKYFISRILPAMNPSKSKFSTSKTQSVLSDIFTPCDEAYGLLLIHNELNVLDNEERMNGRQSVNRPQVQLDVWKDNNVHCARRSRHV